MKRYYKPTLIVILATVVLVTGYDIWAVVMGYDRTISYTLGQAAYAWPAIPFVFGFLAGHLFFDNSGNTPAIIEAPMIQITPGSKL